MNVLYITFAHNRYKGKGKGGGVKRNNCGLTLEEGVPIGGGARGLDAAADAAGREGLAADRSDETLVRAVTTDEVTARAHQRQRS